MFVVSRTWGDTLVESDPEAGEAVPNLAESWEPPPDAAVWTFRLRDDVRFHDGSKRTVADAVATLGRHTDEASQSGALGLLAPITGIEEREGHLVITLDQGNADLPLILTDCHLIVQPNGGRDDPSAAIGTGPYRLTEFQPGVRITFERNADDYRDDRGPVESAEIIVINDDTTRVASLSSGASTPSIPSTPGPCRSCSRVRGCRS